MPQAQWGSISLGLFNWSVWAFATLLVTAQFTGIIWSSMSRFQNLFYGRSPFNPPDSIAGTNDEPYTDRSIVCMAQGRSFVPMQLSAVLRDPKLSIVVDSTGTAVNSYRVVKRERIEMDSSVYSQYIHMCERIDYTLEAIQDSCDVLGYNVTRDALRITDDIYSDTTKIIPRALPILIMPFWDMTVYAHFTIPGWDGMACVFRLDGTYISKTINAAVMRAVPRSTRETKTEEWLRKSGGIWRNGWYDDGSGQRWSSDMMTTTVNSIYGLESRQFDVLTNSELSCPNPQAVSECHDFPLPDRWGLQSWSVDHITRHNQVYISNGTHFGQFMFEGVMKRTIENKYSLETFISNMSVFVLLFRWFVTMAAMLNSYRVGVAPWQTIGIGCLSSSRAFNILPIMLLPRLKMTMAAFWSLGCEFEGQQRALSEAWFAVYPAIVELMLLYFSLLNSASKIAHRRMSDALFGPSVLILALLHQLRLRIVKAGWLEFDSRIPTAVLSDEFASLGVLDCFKGDTALRLNGNAKPIFVFKLVVLAINLIPLVLSESMTRSGKTIRSYPQCDIEKTLALRASNIGGLGMSSVYRIVSTAADTAGPILPRLIPSRPHDQVAPLMTAVETFDPTESTLAEKARPSEPTPQRHAVIGYEISRLGYLVFGGKFLISYDDWYVLTSLAPLRVVEKLWNHRISVFNVTKTSNGYQASATARLCRLDDKELRRIRWFDVTVIAFV